MDELLRLTSDYAAQCLTTREVVRRLQESSTCSPGGTVWHGQASMWIPA